MTKLNSNQKKEAPKPKELSIKESARAADKVIVLEIETMGLNRKELKINSMNIFSFIYE
jgi:hypothetical protein